MKANTSLPVILLGCLIFVQRPSYFGILDGVVVVVNAWNEDPLAAVEIGRQRRQTRRTTRTTTSNIADSLFRSNVHYNELDYRRKLRRSRGSDFFVGTGKEGGGEGGGAERSRRHYDPYQHRFGKNPLSEKRGSGDSGKSKSGKKKTSEKKSTKKCDSSSTSSESKKSGKSHKKSETSKGSTKSLKGKKGSSESSKSKAKSKSGSKSRSKSKSKSKPQCEEPTLAPVDTITANPSAAPTKSPTAVPSIPPTTGPSMVDPPDTTSAPTIPKSSPPTGTPTTIPTLAPTQPDETNPPTLVPSLVPTITFSETPSFAPSEADSMAPSTTPSSLPTFVPTMTPSAQPSLSMVPSAAPSPEPPRIRVRVNDFNLSYVIPFLEAEPPQQDFLELIALTEDFWDSSLDKTYENTEYEYKGIELQGIDDVFGAGIPEEKFNYNVRFGATLKWEINTTTPSALEMLNNMAAANFSEYILEYVRTLDTFISCNEVLFRAESTATNTRDGPSEPTHKSSVVPIAAAGGVLVFGLSVAGLFVYFKRQSERRDNSRKALLEARPIEEITTNETSDGSDSELIEKFIRVK